MDLNQFSAMNRHRCETAFNHELYSWSAADWITAILGELGEAANIAKKLKRIEDCIPGNKDGEDEESLQSELLAEIADTFIYLDLFVQSEGSSLSSIVPKKFNHTSKQVGYIPRMPVQNG